MERKELKDTYSYDVRYYKADDADAVIDVMEASIKELEERIAHTNYINKTLGEGLKDREARIKELEKEVDSVKMNSGYVAFMEAQARIKELDKRIKELEEQLLKEHEDCITLAKSVLEDK